MFQRHFMEFQGDFRGIFEGASGGFREVLESQECITRVSKWLQGVLKHFRGNFRKFYKASEPEFWWLICLVEVLTTVIKRYTRCTFKISFKMVSRTSSSSYDQKKLLAKDSREVWGKFRGASGGFQRGGSPRSPLVVFSINFETLDRLSLEIQRSLKRSRVTEGFFWEVSKHFRGISRCFWRDFTIHTFQGQRLSGELQEIFRGALECSQGVWRRLKRFSEDLMGFYKGSRGL